jgi:putative ABC transport system permease protein
MRAFIRLFLKGKSYYLTNILGLAVGLAAVGFSILYFQHELTYDSFHRKANRIYRISYQNDSGWFASLHRMYVAALMQDTIPEIEELSRVRRWHPKYVYVDNKKFYESKVLMTDPGSKFFDMFDFPFIEGLAERSLAKENSVVITSSLAKKYFGNKPALGESILYDTMALTITGVLADLPTNTTFNFELLIANQQAMKMANGSFTFVALQDNTDISKLEAEILAAHIDDKFHKMKGIKVMPLQDLHFDANFTYELKAAGNASYLWILGAVGGTILLIAFFNFLNLSVALYARRSREIAVRKSVGATSILLSRQFYLESVVTIAMSFVLALTMIYMLMPSLNELMELSLPNPLTSLPFLVTMMILLPAMILLTGIYPGLILPRIHILDLFKQTGITTHHGMRLRMMLLGLQLVVLFFVCCSLYVIRDQFEYIKNKDLGFKKEGVIKIRRAWEVDSAHYHVLRNQLLEYPAVEVVSQGYAPGDEDYGVTYRGDDGSEVKDGALIQMSDYDYLPALGIKPISGLIASSDDDNLPKRSCVINETMAKSLGYDQPVGRTITVDPGLDQEETYTIDGVVSDFHFSSLHHSIAPQILLLDKVSRFVVENVLVKVRTENISETVDFIQSKIDAIVPGIPVEISFLEDDLDRLYKQETRLSKLVTILFMISLVLSIVGLVALCSYMVEFRQKEIAIRKVLGAATEGIVLLFTGMFVRTTIIAFILATPVCYWMMNRWVEEFAYREQIGIMNFVLVLISVIVIVVGLSVSQTVRAANLNPTKVLKE